jgi:hypothetical protein
LLPKQSFVSRGEKLRPRTITSIQKVLEAAGVEFIGGVHTGYNWQIGSWLLGVEGDVEDEGQA